MLKIFTLTLALLGSVAVAQAPAQQSVAIPKQIVKILSRGDGASAQTAYKVNSVRQEYEVLAALGLTPGRQSLVHIKRPYDVIEATDPSSGVTREVWFDISSFYPPF